MTDFARQLRVARTMLDWDEATMARALRLGGTPEKAAARVREMELGKRDISGPVQVAVEAFLSGWRPADWAEPGSAG